MNCIRLDTNKRSKPNIEEAKRACEEGKNQLEKKERARIKQMMKYLVC